MVSTTANALSMSRWRGGEGEEYQNHSPAASTLHDGEVEGEKEKWRERANSLIALTTILLQLANLFLISDGSNNSLLSPV